MLPHASPPIVLSFAATDPSGGAGIQADLMTTSALNCHCLSVITAVTVQDSVGVDRIEPVAGALLEQQARKILADIPVNAFKIGLIGSTENVDAIARVLADYPEIPVVLDPVLASGRGDSMATATLIDAMRHRLLPLTTVLTPNSPEARRLAGNGPEGTKDMPLAHCADQLLALGCRYVLVTGTHEETQRVVNTLYGRTGVIRADNWDRLPGCYHGSGCTLASAVAAYLAHGTPIDEAAQRAQEYAWQALAHGFRAGKGQFIPNRFFKQFML